MSRLEIAHQCPLIRFLGREAYISDWFGEKLNEAYVSRVLQEVFHDFEIMPHFAMLACDTYPPQPAYVLYVESQAPDGVLCRVAEKIESALSESFHYNYALHLGQLGPLRVFRTENAAQTYLNSAQHNGQRAGGIKQLALDRRAGWSRIFQGGFIQREMLSNTSK